MKVQFYPRDIGMFRDGEYDFSIRHQRSITLEAKHIWDYKIFHDRQELIEYLKSKGVRLDDPKNPLEFDHEPNHHHYGNCYSVVQWSLLGYMKELV